MITQSNVYEIVHDKAASLGVERIHHRWDKIKGFLREEAIVIVVSTPIETDIRWKHATVHVNICVPDCHGEENSTRLKELEKESSEWIKEGFTGMFDGTRYDITEDSSGIERDDALKCSYVNLVLLFEILNVK